MTYLLNIKKHCKDQLKKASKKNPTLEKSITNKIEQILNNPLHFKPLRNSLKGERRVHILKNFVLRYEINEKNKTVTLIFFGHHDEAYE